MRRAAIVAALLGALSLWAAEVSADQCAVVNERQARIAASFLRPGSLFLRYCAPCGETLTSHTPEIVRSASAAPDDSGTWRVTLNGEEVDFAYVYIRDPQGNLMNLAALAGCPTQGVAPRIALPPVRR